jgi:cell division transport system ATP-binding protein
MIKFTGVSFSYGSHVILNDVSLEVRPAEFVFLVGQTGAGKSTILRMIYMDIMPARGVVVVGRYHSSHLQPRQTPYLRRTLGIVFQDFRLLEDRDVYENVAFAQLCVGVPARDITKNVMRVLTQVGLWDKRHRLPRQLSGGEQQRVAIARAVVNSPKILLADEPTGNLDPVVAQEIIDLLFRINEGGTCVIFSTHDHEIVKTFGQRVMVVDGGRVVSDVERRVPERRDSRLENHMYQPDPAREERHV